MPSSAIRQEPTDWDNLPIKHLTVASDDRPITPLKNKMVYDVEHSTLDYEDGMTVVWDEVSYCDETQIYYLDVQKGLKHHLRIRADAGQDKVLSYEQLAITINTWQLHYITIGFYTTLNYITLYQHLSPNTVYEDKL